MMMTLTTITLINDGMDQPLVTLMITFITLRIQAALTLTPKAVTRFQDSRVPDLLLETIRILEMPVMF
jgi:hypothetical protein